MIPIRDRSNVGTVPLLTYLIIAVNVVIFVYSFIMGPRSIQVFMFQYGLVPQRLMQGETYYTLATSMFLHGSIGHLVTNMLFLRIFGNNLEDHLGHVRYLFFYVLCGVGGSALQIIFNPGSSVPMLGASGAIAGLMGGYLLLFPNNKIDVLFLIGFLPLTVTLPAATMVIYWILAQFLGGVGQLATSGQGGVAYLAHIGGFLSGIGLIGLAEKTNEL
jgi:membrane associated rhomboid family serine protease